jgi:hypothetical protein
MRSRACSQPAVHGEDFDMPMTFGEITTSKGRRCLLVESEGLCDLADGQALQARLVPGQPHHFGLVFSRAAKSTEFSAELRRFFPTMGTDSYLAMASVITSPVVRAAVKLLVRLTPRSAANFGVFASDAEALAWLDDFAESAGRAVAS